MYMNLASLLFVLLVVLSTSAPAADLPTIVPAPHEWQPATGSVDVLRAPLVIAPADEAKLRPTAQIVQEDFAALGFPRPEIVVGQRPAGGPAITFTLTDKPLEAVNGGIEEQAHAIDITPAGVTISAHDCGGVYQATRSLLQMLAPGPRDPARLPCGRIVDAPLVRLRMLMLDVGRKPFPIETLDDYLRVLGWYKMNVLHLHLSDSAFDNHYGGFRVQCDTFPGLTSKDCFYTKDQLRAFQDRAAAMGIMILPEIDMPGHAAAFCMLWPELAWRQNPYAGNLDVTNPQTIPRMKKVLDEIMPLFRAPYFHIGTDEYGVPCKDAAERVQAGEAFRRFINEMNAYIRSKGKECVIWDGWEHMKGTTEIDPTVVVDMWWGCFDTAAYMRRGHKVINSNQGCTYLTSGRPTYGVNNAFIYTKFQPNTFGKVNPPMSDPHFLGTKLHVWFGQGPSGWTMTEEADHVLPSIPGFAEMLWGRRASPDFAAFQERVVVIGRAPGTTFFNRLTGPGGVILDEPKEIVLAKMATSVPLPLARAARADLEFPWTLRIEVRKDADNGRGVILSSDLAEICASYTAQERRKVADPAGARGKPKFEKITHRGLGLVRATGNWGPTPAESKMAPENSRVLGDPLPSGKWVKLAIVSERNKTTVYIDGKPAGSVQGKRFVCPLRRYGSPDAENTFLGAVRNLRVVDRAEIP